ncbi:MAG: ATP-binding cassette domain-containing protein [Nanoarchaeota archaeon]|nr:ATP-binding cassette domain-containing protein [Nanoarchaeota archaeon]
MGNIIESRRLSKDYRILKRGKGRFAFFKTLVSRDYKIVRALKNVTFDIREGEFVGIVGPNGAGKSTLAKILTGILTPSSGKVKVMGLVPYESRRKYTQNIGVVFGQRTQLWWDLPVKESFNMLKHIYKIPEKDFQKNMKIFNKILEIDKYMMKPVRKLSLGERMRCDVAASLLHNPKVIFLDEPTIGLDVEAKHNLRQFLKHVNEQGVTVILTTHDMGDIEELCPRTIIIDHGKVIIDTPTSELRGKVSKERTLIIDFIGKPSKIKTRSGIKIIGREGDRILLSVDIRKHCVSDIVREMLTKYKISDVTIEQPSIEEVIRRIYKGEL